MATARQNLQELRRQLDLLNIPTFHSNADTRDLPVLVAVIKNDWKIYTVISNKRFMVSEGGGGKEHETIEDAVKDIEAIRERLTNG